MIFGRVEVVDYTDLEHPQVLLLTGVEATFAVHDGGKTLKVFIQKRGVDD